MNRASWPRVMLAACFAVGCRGPGGARDESPPRSAEARRESGGAAAIAQPPSSATAPETVPSVIRGFCQHAPQDGERPLQGFEPVERSFVASAAESGIELPLRCVVRSREQWDALRALSTQAAYPDSTADFGREMLLVATMGFRPTTGYFIAFGPVLTRSDTLIAVVVGTSAQPGIQEDLVTTPIAVVRVAARPGPVLWVERERR
jgi:hypothetical protein